MKKFIPMQKKNERRPANSSMARPVSFAARMYSSPSASVNANSCTHVAPASCMWYPEIEIELNCGMFLAVYPMMSATMRIDGAGG